MTHESTPTRDDRRRVNHPEPFDVGRLDNDVAGPRVLLDVIHAGVAAWGVLLAIGVFVFGGEDWRESLLVLAVFAAFLVPWRLAMRFSERKQARLAGTKAASEKPSAPATPHTAESDAYAETEPVADANERTVAESDFASR